MEVNDRYRALVERIEVRVEPVKFLLAWLHKETDWLKSPASKKYHGSWEGGLLEHSVGTAEVALNLSRALRTDIPEESIVIVGLFHDLGKLGGIGDDGKLKPRYKKIKDNEWVYNTEITEIGLAERSLYYLCRFVPLSDAEVQAILYHDGQYIDQNKFIAHRETPLLCILHWADYWNGHVLEAKMPTNLGNYGVWYEAS